jgi:hypothetical protein
MTKPFYRTDVTHISPLTKKYVRFHDLLGTDRHDEAVRELNVLGWTVDCYELRRTGWIKTK